MFLWRNYDLCLFEGGMEYLGGVRVGQLKG